MKRLNRQLGGQRTGAWPRSAGPASATLQTSPSPRVHEVHVHMQHINVSLHLAAAYQLLDMNCVAACLLGIASVKLRACASAIDVSAHQCRVPDYARVGRVLRCVRTSRSGAARRSRRAGAGSRPPRPPTCRGSRLPACMHAQGKVTLYLAHMNGPFDRPGDFIGL